MPRTPPLLDFLGSHSGQHMGNRLGVGDGRPGGVWLLGHEEKVLHQRVLERWNPLPREPDSV